ncbi:MAG: fused DSP-PTPase phosphatase/NAD kinase-like protein [Cypionkella sp.]
MARAFKKRMLDLQQRLTDTYGTDISTPAARRTAWWHFQLMDHAFLRTLWTNLDEIAPGVWRSNQPSPAKLRKYQRQLGLKSVLNLRGATQQGFYLFELETCRELGLHLHDIPFSARRSPTRESLLQLLDLFPKIEKPFLMHCKSGADRTGLVAALYLMEIDHRPLAEVKRQLSLRYLHLKSTDTGIMDHFLTLFEAEAQGRSLREWIENGYDRDRLTASFDALRKGGR